MKSRTRLFIISAGLFVLAVAATQFIWPDINTRNIFELNEPELLTKPVETTSVVIDFGNGKTIKGNVSTQSAYQALVALAKESNTTVETRQYEYGVMVTKIGDTTASKNSGWTYSVNGKLGQIASDRYIIYPGDIVEWKFTKF